MENPRGRSRQLSKHSPHIGALIKTELLILEHVTYNFFFLTWWIPEEETKRSKQNVNDSNDGHHPGKADGLSDGASDGRT